MRIGVAPIRAVIVCRPRQFVADKLLDLIESQRVEENGAFSIYRVTMEMQEEELRKSISELEYQIFCLRREGYSYREIAQRVNVTEKKVENTLMKLRRMLRGM